MAKTRTTQPGDRSIGGHGSRGYPTEHQPVGTHLAELRNALAASAKNHPALTTRAGAASSGRRSQGSTWSAISVQGFCQCGWHTSWYPWATAAATDARTSINFALDDHYRRTGHQQFRHDGVPEVDGYHQRCGWFHDFQAACPAPPDSSTGRINRIHDGPGFRDPERSLDRLSAIAEMRAWLEDQQTQAIIGARFAGCSWPDIAEASHVTIHDALAQWGPLIARYEAIGLLDPDAPNGAKPTNTQRRPQ
jgi:hypothetical protein